ncbi:MAG: putative ABC transport system permease protein [Hyphomicrobiaceae bacterium]|jgi:putative ABC transport system permease protein
MILLRLAQQSLRNRWLTALLTVLAIAVSVMLLLGVEKVRTGAKASFANTISGTDLVVGARSGSIQLLLYSVFRIGNATNNMTWRSYQAIQARPEVAWSVPLSLGDSHRGFRVLGTTPDYFKHYKYRRDRSLTLDQGQVFDDLFDAVIGADVARDLGYKVGDAIVVAHGAGRIGIQKHDDKPFRVSGVLAKTGTPVDRTVHVSLQAIEAVHLNWKNGAPQPGRNLSAGAVRRLALQPKAITAALIGVTSKIRMFKLQRYINTYRSEPLSAILPGLTLYELWALVGTAETALFVVSFMVVVTAILGMVTMILATLGERRREIAILRSVGAGPVTVIGMLVSEAVMLCTAGVLLGLAATYALLYALRPLIDDWYGLHLGIEPPATHEWLVLLGIVVAGGLAGLLPALRAYKQSLADGMMVKS